MEKWQDNKQIHDAYWGKVLDNVKSKSSNYTDVKSEWAGTFKYEVGGKNDFQYILDGKTIQGDFNKYIADKNKYVQDRLNKHVTSTTDVIIDLGAGWGRQSIRMAYDNPSYNILTGELSDTGRQVTNHFKDKYSLNIETFPFNWCEYDSFIELLSNKNYNEIVILTSNTIEQIGHIDIEFFRALLALPIDKVKCIHIEPVGFQYDNKPFPFNNHYNRNLKSVLDMLEINNEIKVTDVIRKYYGHTVNETGQHNTLIEWEKLS